MVMDRKPPLMAHELAEVRRKKNLESSARAWETKREKYPERYPRHRWLVDEETGCWVWQMAKDRHGYGKWSKTVGGRKVGPQAAHRRVYQEHFGVELPASTALHHECGRKDCVNPDHLREMGVADHTSHHNSERFKGGTICRNGHEYTPENTYRRPDGGRRCRTCQNEKYRLQKLREVSERP